MNKTLAHTHTCTNKVCLCKNPLVFPIPPYLCTISSLSCLCLILPSKMWYIYLSNSPLLHSLSLLSSPFIPFLPYLVVQRSRTQTTWNCTVLSMTQIPWVAGVGWASWVSTPGCQRGARCPRCTPTVTDRRAPGRQTCPQCVQPCAAERPRNNPCSG